MMACNIANLKNVRHKGVILFLAVIVLCTSGYLITGYLTELVSGDAADSQVITDYETTDRDVEDIKTGKHTIDLNRVGPEELFNRSVIVTAISQNHFKEAKGMIGTAQEFLPNTRIIMYDLGLTNRGRKEVKKLCNVHLRQMDFKRYPPHVTNLLTYAWKPIIIEKTLEEFGVIFWCDASARFQKDPQVLFSLLREQSGWMKRTNTLPSQVMIDRTHPRMFREFGIDIWKFQADKEYIGCIEANRMLFANTALIRENLITPWVDCALRPECISPKGSALQLYILNGAVEHTHRFDQTAIDLIAYKNLRETWTGENDVSLLFESVCDITRTTRGWQKAKYCLTSGEGFQVQGARITIMYHCFLSLFLAKFANHRHH